MFFRIKENVNAFIMSLYLLAVWLVNIENTVRIGLECKYRRRVSRK